MTYRGFRIVGLEREASHAGQDLNDYWLSLTQKISARLPSEIGAAVAADARVVNYRDRVVAILPVKSGPSPVFFDGDLLTRDGSSTVVADQPRYQEIFNRFA